MIYSCMCLCVKGGFSVSRKTTKPNEVTLLERTQMVHCRLLHLQFAFGLLEPLLHQSILVRPHQRYTMKDLNLQEEDALPLAPAFMTELNRRLANQPSVSVVEAVGVAPTSSVSMPFLSTTSAILFIRLHQSNTCFIVLRLMVIRTVTQYGIFNLDTNPRQVLP